MAQNNDKSGGDGGTKKVVYAAFTANLLITISKFIAGFITGSASLLAEGAHSIADTVNQVFLLVSLRSARSKPDRTHPYGYGKDRFFWSLIVAVGLFVAGAVFSFYEGVSKILEESGGESASFLAGYIVLGAAFVFEGASFVITIREFRKSAREEERTFREHFRTTRNTTMKVPLYEDSAALVGLVIAFAGLLFSQLSGSHVYDGIASIAIGVVLVFVAYELGRDSRALLLGEAVPPEDEERLRETITGFEEVNDIVRLLTMHLGPESVLVNAEIHVADGMNTNGIEDLIARITKKIGEQLPEVTQTFLELHPPQEEGQTTSKSD